MSNLLWILIVIFVIAWILGWGVFKVASGVIHLLIVVAVILLILNLIQYMRRKV
jgi:uncharacterized membrane protein YtjA (UPF0391 family)